MQRLRKPYFWYQHYENQIISLMSYSKLPFCRAYCGHLGNMQIWTPYNNRDSLLFICCYPQYNTRCITNNTSHHANCVRSVVKRPHILAGISSLGTENMSKVEPPIKDTLTTHRFRYRIAPYVWNNIKCMFEMMPLIIRMEFKWHLKYTVRAKLILYCQGK